jgi:hypothetical protein
VRMQLTSMPLIQLELFVVGSINLVIGALPQTLVELWSSRVDRQDAQKSLRTKDGWRPKRTNKLARL